MMTDVAFWLLVLTGAGWSRLVAFDCAPLSSCQKSHSPRNFALSLPARRREDPHELLLNEGWKRSCGLTASRIERERKNFNLLSAPRCPDEVFIISLIGDIDPATSVVLYYSEES